MQLRLPPTASLVIAAALSACALSEAGARARGANELQCPEAYLAVKPRPDRSDNTFEVIGCGRSAIYTCMNRAPRYCVREPDENPHPIDAP